MTHFFRQNFGESSLYVGHGGNGKLSRRVVTPFLKIFLKKLFSTVAHSGKWKSISLYGFGMVEFVFL